MNQDAPGVVHVMVEVDSLDAVGRAARVAQLLAQLFDFVADAPLEIGFGETSEHRVRFAQHRFEARQ